MKMSRYRVEVNFTQAEFEDLKAISEVTHLSRAEVLRRRYFRKPIVVPERPTQEELDTLENHTKQLAETLTVYNDAIHVLRQYGNNLNQLAKQANTNYDENTYDAVVKLTNEIRELKQYLKGKEGETWSLSKQVQPKV